MAIGDYELEYSRWWVHTDSLVIVKKLQAMHGSSTSHCGLDRLYCTLVLKRGGKPLITEGLEAMSAVSRLKPRAERERRRGGLDSRR
jgi:hypothetical protein